MTVIWTLTPRASQPQVGALVDPGSVFARNLASVATFGTSRADIADIGRSFSSNQIGSTPSPLGIGIKTDASGMFLTRSTALSLSAGVDYTAVFAVANVGFNGANPGVWRSVVASDFNIFQAATGRPWIRVNSSDVLKPASGAGLTAGLNYVMGFRVRSAKDAAFAINGGILHTATHAIATIAQTILNFGMQSTQSEALSGTYCLSAFWRRGLTDAELCEITGNPWQMFAPPPRRMWPSASGGPAALAGNAIGQVSTTGALSTQIRFASTVAAIATVTGALTTQILLGAAVGGIVTAQGTLTAGSSLAAAAAGVVTAQAALTTAIRLASSVSGIVTAQGTLNAAPSGLAASIAGQATAVGALTTAIRLVGSASGQVSVTATLFEELATQGGFDRNFYRRAYQMHLEGRITGGSPDMALLGKKLSGRP